MAQCPRQHAGIDPAGGSAGQRIDNDAQLELAADVAQQTKIIRLGVVFRIAGVGVIEEFGLGALCTVGNAVQRARGANELEDFLADAVDIDGKRNAAEADQRNAEFFLAQEHPPGASGAGGRW